MLLFSAHENFHGFPDERKPERSRFTNRLRTRDAKFARNVTDSFELLCGEADRLDFLKSAAEGTTGFFHCHEADCMLKNNSCTNEGT